MARTPKTEKTSPKKPSSPPKPYDVLPPPEIGGGDADLKELMAAVGEALSTWEGIEEAFADIFAVLTGGTFGPSGHAARRAYGTIVSFQARKKMLGAAAQATLADAEFMHLLDELTSLLKDAGNFSTRRNEIAHGVAKTLTFGIDSILDDADPTWYLFPASYNNSKFDIIDVPKNIIRKGGEKDDECAIRMLRERVRQGLGTYKYNSEQLRYYTGHFCTLKTRARELGRRLEEALAKQ